MGLHLFGMEKDNEPIPEPTQETNIKVESNQCLILIEVIMPAIRAAIGN